MEKHDKDELLSRDEMKKTKGGAGVPPPTFTAPTKPPTLDHSLQAEADSIAKPIAPPVKP
jgi:hypothetical protein